MSKHFHNSDDIQNLLLQVHGDACDEFVDSSKIGLYRNKEEMHQQDFKKYLSPKLK